MSGERKSKVLGEKQSEEQYLSFAMPLWFLALLAISACFYLPPGMLDGQDTVAVRDGLLGGIGLSLTLGIPLLYRRTLSSMWWMFWTVAGVFFFFSASVAFNLISP